MAALNESSVVKRFHNVSATQDSIQSLSLWVIHHKAHHERIVELWFKVLKKAKIPHRLTMFYLCNDIVQTCKRKHAIIYKDAFKEILKDAILLVRDSSIRKNISRIFTIWEERKVYDGEFIATLHSALEQTQPAATLNSRLLAEFQPSTVVEKIQSYTSLEKDGEIKRSQLNLTRMDALNLEAVKQLKDRQHGKEFSQQFEEACVKLEDYIQHVEKEIKEGQVVIELLEQGELFYDAQYGEAKIVANAYKNFGTRVSNLKRKLEEHMKGLPSPIPSPTPEAPSPGNTPPKLRETLDNIDPIDMDLSDDDENGIFGSEGRRRDSTMTTGSYMQPIASITEILMKQNKQYTLTDSPKSVDSVPSPKGSPIGMSPTHKSGSIPAYASFLNDANATASLLAHAKDFNLSDSPKPIPTLGSTSKGGGLEEFLAGGDSTPVRDENMEEGGRGTPVQDEAQETENQAVNASIISQGVPPPPPPPGPPGSMASMAMQMPQHMMGPPGPPPPMQHQHQHPLEQEDDGAADNPMEFLTQLIIHHQAQKKGNKDSQNEFLQSLTNMAHASSSDTKTSSEPWTSWKDQPGQMSQHTPPVSSMSHMPMPAPPPPPPSLPMPPRPPLTPTSFSYQGSQSLPAPPVQSSSRLPLTPQSPQGPPRMPGGPQSSPFPGGPPLRPPGPTSFNNGMNQWRNPPPPPPPPPVSSTPSGQPFDSNQSYPPQNFNNQNAQNFNNQNSQGFSVQTSQGFNSQNSQNFNNPNSSQNYNDPNDYEPQGYDNQSEYNSNSYEADGDYSNEREKFQSPGLRGRGMPRFPRPNHNNLTTIQTQDFDNDDPNKGSVPSLGGMPRPPRPPFPPGMRIRGPNLPSLQMPSPRLGPDDSEEFRAKLKRKTSVTSPTGPGMRNLTEIATQGDDMDLDEQDSESEQAGVPIATLAGMGPRSFKQDSDPASPAVKVPLQNIVQRPRMPQAEGSPFRGHFDQRDFRRDNYARRDGFQEPFRHEPFYREGYGTPKRMPPPRRGGGYFPRY